MTIKAIKEKYKDYHLKTGDHKTMFKVFTVGIFTGDPSETVDKDKYVVVVTDCEGYGKTVSQVVRVRDGQEMLFEGSCRPCDSLSDAVDVACEMEWRRV